MEPYFDDGQTTLYLGKVENVLPTLPDASVDAVVTDPPYNLPGGFMGREWDRFEHGQAFQAWCEVWATECLRILKPGGYLLAFGGTRTWHRMVSAIEDAGFDIRDGIADLTGQDAPGLMWTYGSGFPKSMDVGKAIDKSKRREFVLAAVELGLTIPGNNLHDWTKAEHSPGDAWWERFKAHLSPEDWGRIERVVIGKRTSGAATVAFARAVSSGYDVTAPATDDAARWEGWGTALKPAWEPIAVARKPVSGTVAANVVEHGTGALNIDATRVATSAADAEAMKRANTPGSGRMKAGGSPIGTFVRSNPTGAMDTTKGRWPTNLVLTHGDCAEACAADCPVAELDRQSGHLKSGANPTRRSPDKIRDAYGDFAGQEECTPARGADEGGASRFFPVFRYQAKAPTSERPKVDGDAHETVKPLALMRWLVRLVTQPGGTVLDPFLGSGTTAEACAIEGFQCIGIERDEKYIPLIKARLGKPLQAVLGFEEPA